MRDKVNEIFEVPNEAKSFIHMMISDSEMRLIYMMGDKLYTRNELIELISDNFDINPKQFIENSYNRSVLDKENRDEIIYFKVSNVYSRLAVFAQFENDIWENINFNIRKSVDEWYVNEYANRSKSKVEAFRKGEVGLIENAYFFTLEETLKLIEESEKNLYVLPCNCKAVAMNCSKPIDVCIQFEEGINTMADRGWGKKITKDEAKEIIKEANKAGLMHTSETDSAICNCDGCCCYPIRASKILKTKNEWPKKIHKINWDKEKCIDCGKCTKICNFEAFYKNNKVVEFNEDKCCGCTICKDNCPVGAINLIY